MWVPIEDNGNVTSLDIFGPPGKNQDYIEVFHVQFRNSKSLQELNVEESPDPDRPVFLRLEEEEQARIKA